MTDYCTADQCGQALSPTGEGVSDAHASPIARAITEASRWIDRHVGDQFAEITLDGVESAALQVPASDAWWDRKRGVWCVEIPWTATLTTVQYDASDSGTWTTASASDYLTEPLDGRKNGQTGWPTERLVFKSIGLRDYGVYPVVKVTGLFGWTARPQQVTECAISLAKWIVQQRDKKTPGWDVIGEGVGFARASAAGLLAPIDFYARPWGTFLPGIA